VAGAPAMNLAVPVGDARSAGGRVLVGRLNLQPIGDALLRLDLGLQEYAYVVDESGRVIVGSPATLVGRRPPASQIDQMTTPHEGVVGKVAIGVTADVPGASWRLVVEQLADAAYNPLKYVTVFVIELLLAGLYLTMAISWWLGRRLVRPIRLLQEGAAIVGAGDLGHVVELRTGDELEDLAASFNATVRNLAQLSALRRQFVDVLSHELNTPLVGLRAILDVAGDDQVATPAFEATHRQMALEEVDRMQRLVQNLLAWSLPEEGLWQPTNRVPLDLAALAARSLSGLQVLAKERGIAVRVQISPTLPPLTADPDRLAQVLVNLVHNAIQYTPAGGEVTLQAEDRGAEICVVVRDTGVGIPPDEQPRVFEAFWRGRATARNGTGLGLAISRRIVELHGGRIWVESVPGQGSTFAFTIPTQAKQT